MNLARLAARPMKSALPVLILLGACLPARALNVVTSTIQPNGPRSGNNNNNFFNVEGSNNLNNASYGIVRFDVSGVKSGFDAQFGAGNWTLTDVALQLTESLAAFSKAGALGFAYTNEDNTDIKTSASPYKFGGGAPVQDAIATGAFTPVSNGTLDVYDLFNASSGSLALQNDILNDTLTTLVINPGDPTVAATWRGQNPANNLPAPILILKAANQAGVVGTFAVTNAIPEPGSMALLLSALPLLTIRRRKSA